jgi:hypothetical protein
MEPISIENLYTHPINQVTNSCTDEPHWAFLAMKIVDQDLVEITNLMNATITLI